MRRLMWGAACFAVLFVAAVGSIGPTQAAGGGPTFAGGPASPTPRSSSERAAFFAGRDEGPTARAEARAITVDPNSGLVDGQVVAVSGSGFGGDSFDGLFPCAKGLGIDGCDASAAVLAVQPDPDGTFSSSFEVHPILHTASGDIDCRSHAAGCRLAANDRYTLVGAGTADITFDPDAPLQPPPTVSVDPSTDLVDGQVVQVEVTGLSSGAYADIAECPAGFTDPLSQCGNVWNAQADDDGSVSTPYEVRATFTSFPALKGERGSSLPTVDCRTDACVLAVAPTDDLDRYGSIALGFDPDAPLRPELRIGVYPKTGLVDDQTVSVAMTGYTPAGPVDVVECSLNSDLDGDGCELAHAHHLTADANGQAETTYVVHVTLDTASGTVRCRGGSCILVAVDRSVPIAFGHGYTFDYLDFAGATTAPVADPTAMTPQFTG
jgi:hypothetical protein